MTSESAGVKLARDIALAHNDFVMHESKWHCVIENDRKDLHIASGFTPMRRDQFSIVIDKTVLVPSTLCSILNN